ncbi:MULTISPECIES: HTH-type transcriptional repressor PurR [unclassified Photobacterium]|uniref:HTH-type transcriptional repressor PurR n=1 Tax=unclassified Photobacterium TaxID=2628852 RepID=UPI000D15FCBE|nr:MULTISPECIES: HTH-type transcriptional repressor PurR [unclassified Photobacterium]PSV28401.1 HTH-type transcriptional repressor PurR [Photobacterium sp. GB-56]PSV34413.1 HTH-type transcriptional repressor PurR [Photobacterium sp. GB-27]PSV43476.1 HTH-type transcriptional repressor PurR [Photobacterium sp. GB-36]PSV51808.1 HTH-type transcriptional repressor PurR [Photobacterium sp. GB-1]PSV56397.1 HTH-type transcriptional repressor PurR [Photobacterium sp. GB-3]
MATIKDVARMAGVSTTTVSHVINKTRFVAEATQQKVLAAVDELNYAPSAVARSLKCNTTRTIGMLVTKSTNPFFAEVVHGVEEYCYGAGYTLILCNTEGNLEKQRDYLRMLSEKRVDGLLVMCSDLDQMLLDLLERKNDLPMVIMDWGPESPHTDNILDNAENGGYIATKHLIENGHKKIGCLSGQVDKSTCQERLKGFRKAMKEADLTVNANWLLDGDFECESAVEAAHKFIAMEDRPTAIFCFNDIMAMALISTFEQAGLRVPDDISIIGYDNIDLAPYFAPPLTTIHQPKRRLGKKAIEILLERVKDKNHERQTFEMTPKLVERKSVKDLN